VWGRTRERTIAAGRMAIAALVVVTGSGCSTLGLSLCPPGERLTTESKQVLSASPIPKWIPRENAKTVLPMHMLEPGDALLIEPANLERDLRLPADQTVHADGSVDLGPYGRLIVAGRSLEEAESLIERQIANHLRQQRELCNTPDDDTAGQDKVLPRPENCDGIVINVRLLEPVHRFYVVGEVNSPGAYPLEGYETVLDAIVNAGGLTDSANSCDILLSRPTDPGDCRVALPVCYREIVQLGATTTNYQLQPGDRIFVPSRSCLDELMFWRASMPCPRCAGCNRACRNPPLFTAKPMPAVDHAMIPPGSAGRTELADELLEESRPDAPVQGDARRQRFGRDDQPFEPLSPQRPAPISGEPDIDGELDFSPSVE
jgi:polysaccharide biosynthesis/export protein